MKTLAEKIAVMQAFERGEKIACRFASTGGVWLETESPTWNWVHYDYRIAPKAPREWLVLLTSSDEVCGIHPANSDDMVPALFHNPTFKMVLAREVIDEPAVEHKTDTLAPRPSYRYVKIIGGKNWYSNDQLNWVLL